MRPMEMAVAIVIPPWSLDSFGGFGEPGSTGGFGGRVGVGVVVVVVVGVVMVAGFTDGLMTTIGGVVTSTLGGSVFVGSAVGFNVEVVVVGKVSGVGGGVGFSSFTVELGWGSVFFVTATDGEFVLIDVVTPIVVCCMRSVGGCVSTVTVDISPCTTLLVV